MSPVAVFALTACSGEVFDFTEESMEPADSIQFRVPSDLIDLEEEYAEQRVLDSVTLTAVESEDPSLCSVGYQFNYAGGGLDRLVEYANGEAAASSDSSTSGIPTPTVSDPDQAAYQALTRDNSSEFEIGEDYSTAVVPVQCSPSPADDSHRVDVTFMHIDGSNSSRFAEAEVTVMRNGELFIQHTDVSGWQVDSNGNWIGD